LGGVALVLSPCECPADIRKHAFLYGMRMFWVLAGLLVGGGVVIGVVEWL
jgi:hypothetical protein